MYVALLDTTVLWPSLQRDFLLSLAIEGVYRPIWSDTILEELNYCEVEKLEKRGSSSEEAQRRARFLVDQMRAAFEDACVVGWEPLVGSFDLPDPDDEHVVAAALIGGAGAIVTENHKDFPIEKLPRGIDVISAADFLYDTVLIDPDAALRAIEKIANRVGRLPPGNSVEGILNQMENRYRIRDVIDILRPLIG